jgi:hypothetical protein
MATRAPAPTVALGSDGRPIDSVLAAGTVWVQQNLIS